MTVSVALILYNSADYVLETLESAFNQSYTDLELVISDDCSKDNTIAICEEWIALERVKNRFTRIEVVPVPKNTGVSANCNRGINFSHSDWVMMVAGDDILLPNCVADNVDFITKNPEAKMVLSQVKLYQDTFEDKNYMKSIPSSFPNNLMHESISASDQYKLLLESDRINYTPSFFLNRTAIQKLGGYDEENRLVEDYPMWLKLTGSGEKLYYFHKETVGYRTHSKATNNTGDVLIKPSAINNYLIRKKYAHPHLSKIMVLDESWVYKVALLFKTTGITKKTKVNVGLYKLMTVYLNPFFYVHAISRKIS